MKNQKGFISVLLLAAVAIVFTLGLYGISAEFSKLQNKISKLENKPIQSGLLGTQSGSGQFPTSALNNFNDGDIINAGDWNAIERKIGIDNSAVTSSLDYIVRNSTTSVARGGTNKTSYTAGSIVFASSTSILGENNAKLFWDNVNFRLGIGTTAPSSTQHIYTTSSTLEIGASSTTGYACLKMHASSGTIGKAVWIYYDSVAVQIATTTQPSFCQ